ncbi:MAG: phosphatase PAP2 family protein [Planctomycetes bacterium]|nr:phosphatase PAP2 family protein [Planctomycetota bacterium]
MHARIHGVLCASAMTVTGCAALEEHTAARPWEHAWEQFTEQPAQWVPVAATAVATPLLLPFDHQNTLESNEDQFFNTHESTGTAWALGLGFAPVAWGAVDAVSNGDTRFLEVSSEAIALTLASTQMLKMAVNRPRPDHTSQDSFPSGHTSFAFAGATLLARRWADTHDGSALGYVLYLPAAYVGVSRLEGERHWLSDITFGAALGMFVSHLVYDAHYGDAERDGLFRRGVHAEFGPALTDDGAAFGVTLSF